tara:strand:- start:2768 stop:3313 length:546 start_codon:yes stop_codon:yes gene_type:complete
MSYGINDPSQIPAHLLADPENAEAVRGYKLSIEEGKKRMMEVVGEMQAAQHRADAPARKRGESVPTEHEEQVALFAWARDNESRMPGLALMFAIPNGGDRHAAVAAKLKAEGVKAGVPDVFLPVAAGGKHGLWIELKRRKGGRVSEVQAAWMTALSEQGYAVGLSYGADEAIATVLDYLGG